MKKTNTKTKEWKLTPLRRCALTLGKTRCFTPTQLAYRWAHDAHGGAWPASHRKRFGLMCAAYRAIRDLYLAGYLAKDGGNRIYITTQEGAKLI